MKMDWIKITTEKINPNTTDIDSLSPEGILRKINSEDHLVAPAVEKAIPQIAPLVEKIVEALQNGGRLVYVGSGTSGRIGILDAVECRPTFSVLDDQVFCIMAGGSQAFLKAVEGAEDSVDQAITDLEEKEIGPSDVVIGLSASGRTPYVVSALRYAKSKGAVTGCITTSLESEIESIVDFPVVASTGPEILTGSTRMKSGTAQKMICNMISTTTMIRMGKVYQNLMIDVQPTNEKLIARAIRILSDAGGVSKEEAQIKLNRYSSVKMALLSIMTAVEDEEKLKEALIKNKGHLRNAMEWMKHHETR